jgi:hypothetical protein
MTMTGWVGDPMTQPPAPRPPLTSPAPPRGWSPAAGSVEKAPSWEPILIHFALKNPVFEYMSQYSPSTSVHCSLRRKRMHHGVPDQSVLENVNLGVEDKKRRNEVRGAGRRGKRGVRVGYSCIPHKASSTWRRTTSSIFLLRQFWD